MCCWIGSGWCSGNGSWQVVDGQLTHLGDAGRGVQRQRTHLGNAGQGVQRKRTHLGNAGQGVQRQRTHLGGRHGVGNGVHSLAARNEGIYTWMRALCERLRYVRVTCGDWTRVLGPSVTWKHGLTGVVLDPPYSHSERTKDLYSVEADIAPAVQAWCLANGDNPLLRIVLCGYEGEYTCRAGGWCPGRRRRATVGRTTTAITTTRTARRLWLSPQCTQRQLTLFGDATDEPPAADHAD